jgi:hypothetical protein
MLLLKAEQVFAARVSKLAITPADNAFADIVFKKGDISAVS